MNLIATNSYNERLYCYTDKQEVSFQVSGYYVYKNKNIKIPVIGDVRTKDDETMDVILYELDSIYTKKAIFKGKSESKDLKIINGTWQNIQRGNLFTFSLNFSSKTYFTFKEQVLLNHNLWDLKVIFGEGIVLADSLSVIEKQENKNSVAYLLYLQFYSNPNVCGMCGSDPTDEKLVWLKFDKSKREILQKQLFNLTVCRGNTSNDFDEGFRKDWTKISMNIIENQYDDAKKQITNISISKDKFWDGFTVKEVKK